MTEFPVNPPAIEMAIARDGVRVLRDVVRDSRGSRRGGGVFAPSAPSPRHLKRLVELADGSVLVSLIDLINRNPTGRVTRGSTPHFTNDQVTGVTLGVFGRERRQVG